jgi:hypothetical protein
MERDRNDILKLGRRLANSIGFRVIALDGRDMGVLDHVRYEQHTDHPDEVVFRRRRFLRERLVSVRFEQIANVDRRSERVFLTIPSRDVGWVRDSRTQR